MFEQIVSKVRDPKVLKGAGIVVGALAAIGVVALVLNTNQELEDELGMEFDSDPDSDAEETA